VTQWLKDIGGINNNSYGRFMRENGKTDGASNGTDDAAYVYFESVRIFEGKKKTAKRINNDNMDCLLKTDAKSGSSPLACEQPIHSTKIA